MAKKQYGIMPPLPKMVAMMRGSDNRHFVYGIDWLTKAITIYRNGTYEIVPIERVRFVEPTEEEMELLSQSIADRDVSHITCLSYNTAV